MSHTTNTNIGKIKDNILANVVHFFGRPFFVNIGFPTKSIRQPTFGYIKIELYAKNDAEWYSK